MKFSEFQARAAAGEEMSIATSTLPREARPLQGLRAGFLARMLGALIDVGLVALALIIFNGLLTLLRTFFHEVMSYRLPELTASFLIGTGLLWLLWTIGWASTGRSVGMYIMGLRVVNRSGENPSIVLAAIRAAFCVVFPIGLAWVIISRVNRSVQDVVLRTNVINDWVMGLPDLSLRWKD